MKLSTLILTLTLCVFAGCNKKAVEETTAPGKREENIVTLTKENLEHVVIKAEPVAFGNIEMTLKAAGRLTANQNKTAKVNSTLEGRLIKVGVDLNDKVSTGDVLALVQTPELLGRPLELKAPIDGVIIDRKASIGELVGKDKEIFTISDPTDLWAIAEIKERDIGGVKIGQDASFSVLAYPGETFRGKVVRVGNEVESESRTVEARVEINNADGRLKSGMFADIEITTTVLSHVIVVPDSAVQTDEDRQVVFVALDGNRFERRPVALGIQQRDRVEVREGLKPGEKVVTEGSFVLKSEMLKGELGEE
ncbi:MAG TPA: efflux RND transporter periplasmic adaptor subunit [Chthoniobacterales bacterium]|jgi:multidrug efflux pump subunit AcrA (membrane-fusion protein)